MRIFKHHWAGLLPGFALWNQLSPKVRKLLLNPKSDVPRPHDLKDLWPECSELIAQGWLVHDSGKKYKFGGPKGKELHQCLFHMHRQMLFKVSKERGHDQFLEYLRSLLYIREYEPWRRVMGSRGFPTEWGWIGSFLNAPDRHAWERRLNPSQPEEPKLPGSFTQEEPQKPTIPYYLENPEVQRLAGEIITLAKDSPEPLPMEALERFLPAGPELLSEAFMACVRYTLLFPGMDSDLRALFWIWPNLGRRLHSSPVTVPVPVEAVEVDTGWSFLADCTLVLAKAATAPLPVRKNSYPPEIFANVLKELTQGLRQPSQELPAMVTLPDPQRRIELAVLWLEWAKWLRSKGGPTEVLELTEAGRQALNLPLLERWRAMLEISRRHVGLPLRDYFYGPVKFLFQPAIAFGYRGPYWFRRMGDSPDSVAGPEWVAKVFSMPEPGKFYRLEDWLKYVSREHPPADWQLCEAVGMDRVRAVESDADAEHPLQVVLQEFFFRRLLPLGLARLGKDSEGKACFAITENAGFYLHGTGELHLPRQEQEGGKVVLQPDFEILFLGTNPDAYAGLMPYAEGIGLPPGRVFRLTKDSILRAVERGETAGQILDAIGRWLDRPMPANVREQILGWVQSCRVVKVQQALLLFVPDQDTALLVKKSLGDACKEIAPGLLALHETKLPPDKLRKWKKQGIFVQELSGTTSHGQDTHGQDVEPE